MISLLKGIYRRLPADHPLTRKLRACMYHLWIRTRTTEQVFSGIHRNRAWDNPESLSGPGSTLAATENLRRELPRLFERFKIKSVLDAPCGDFHWMSHVDLSGIDYTGADIVPALVEADLHRHAAPGRRFVHLDLLTSDLPDADLLLCRDCLIHLSFENIRRLLDNICGSNIEWVLCSTYPLITANTDNYTGGCRPLNVEIAPFNFPEPRLRIDDGGSREQPDTYRQMALWRREDLTHGLA